MLLPLHCKQLLNVGRNHGEEHKDARKDSGDEPRNEYVHVAPPRTILAHEIGEGVGAELAATIDDLDRRWTGVRRRFELLLTARLRFLWSRLGATPSAQRVSYLTVLRAQ